MLSEKSPKAIDLSHHLSKIALARQTSPLKGLQKYWGKPGIISLAGGLPHPDYFPFSSLTGDALVPDAFPLETSKKGSPLSWLWNLISRTKEKTTPLHIPKYPVKPGDLNLAMALQYSMAGGIPQLQDITKEFTRKVYRPGYDNYTTLVHIGNTDGWVKAVMTLCNPGEGILAAKWTYPSAMSAMVPFGIKPVSVPMDGQGIRSDELRSLLSEWNEDERGMPRPHVMYTIPVGQNPTGVTTEAARKKEIYDVCVEYDIIIVEDDPYYFLQQGPYIRPGERADEHNSSTSDEEYISQLAPSYLRFDYQGRVVRLDSFSKTIAPGCRMGWFTCNPVFAERLERQSETSTQAPCGFGQSLVTALMLEWRHEGYIRWLRALRLQYKQRRDFFVDCLHEEFHLESTITLSGALEGCSAYLAFDKLLMPTSDGHETFPSDPKLEPMFSFVPPTSGMFVWVKLHFEHHLSFKALGIEGLETKLWESLAEAGVLLGPGSMFATNANVDEPESAGHFRISFSNAEPKDMKRAIVIFATVLRKFFKGT